jgi:hypothetical protein
MRQEIFVFGSNKGGIHGAGAAKYAAERYNAQYGVGEGPTGNAYAIPTKDENLASLPLYEIEISIEDFLSYAHRHPDMLFLFTPVGCGLAGKSKKDVWAILKKLNVPTNVVLTSSWLE